MTATLDVTCPSCNKALKVPAQAEGKRVKCKGCLEVFLVKAPKAKTPASAAAPSAEKKPAKKSPPLEESGKKPDAPAPGGADKYKVTWDDEADNDSAAVGVIKEEDVPRCPDCANELDPPDAIVCIHCGFNSRTRAKAETRKVYEPTGAEWTTHLLPGILAVVAVVSLIILDVVCVVNMRDWMDGGLLESDDTGADGKKKMYVRPGFFISAVCFGSLVAIVPLVKLAYKRLVVEYRPPETLLK